MTIPATTPASTPTRTHVTNIVKLMTLLLRHPVATRPHHCPAPLHALHLVAVCARRAVDAHWMDEGSGASDRQGERPPACLRFVAPTGPRAFRSPAGPARGRRSSPARWGPRAPGPARPPRWSTR